MDVMDAEYREINNNIRECWKYISDLLKNFLLIQIILISLFLGGSVIKVENVNISGNPNLESADRRFVLLPFIVIGLIGSFGAMIQNHRLFDNAASFVRRAAYLESKGKFLKDDGDNQGRTLPPNMFMRENLYPGRRFINLKWMLALTYMIFAFLWIYALYARKWFQIDWNFG